MDSCDCENVAQYLTLKRQVDIFMFYCDGIPASKLIYFFTLKFTFMHNFSINQSSLISKVFHQNYFHPKNFTT